MRPFHRTLIRIAALTALSLGALTACEVVDESGPRPRPEPSFPQMCTMEYDPVCAVQSGDRQTFSNACQARAEGFRIIGRGECRRGIPDEGRPDVDRPEPDRPQICTREYDPVCGRRGSRYQTFPNGCTAEAEGFRVIDNGECRRRDDNDLGDAPDRRPGDGDNDRPNRRPGRDNDARPDDDARPERETRREDRACTREFAPVCGRKGQSRKTFPNACTAEAGGFRVSIPPPASRPKRRVPGASALSVRLT